MTRQEEGGELCFRRRAAGQPRLPDAMATGWPPSAASSPSALPARRSFRTVRTHSRGKLDLRRSLRAIVCADGDVPSPLLRRRQTVPRKLLLLIDISGSMKLHTADYLQARACGRARRGPGRDLHLRHAADPYHHGAAHSRPRPGTGARRQHRSTTGMAARASGRRCSPSSRCRALPPSRAVPRSCILSDGLERGGHAEMETAMRRLCARAFRLSLCHTAGRRSALPAGNGGARAPYCRVLDDLVDGSSLAGLTDFILSLARPAPSAATIWRRVS